MTIKVAGLGQPGRAGKDGKDSVVPGPVGPAGKDSTVPGPAGPAGKDSTVPGPAGKDGKDGAASTVPGPAGQRGSLWYQGSGAPAVTAMTADLYLDTATGDVWQFS